ncbi:MAG: hypothetical protein WBE34_10265 [Candidatus Nitrosopolaris sp.]
MRILLKTVIDDYYANLLRLYKVADPNGYSNLKKTYKRKDSKILESGFSDTQAWGALDKCWTGYKIAKAECDAKKLKYYAKGIRKFQRELKKPVLDFPQLGLIGELTNEEERDSNNEWVCRNSRDVQKETEDYELQKIAEDPFRIEHEEDLTKEQEEYFRRIRQAWLDPGSSE